MTDVSTQLAVGQVEFLFKFFDKMFKKSEIFRLDRTDIELLQGVTYFSIIRSLVKRKLQYHLELHGKNVGKEKKSWNVKKVAFVSN
jgi:hypothetical protein